MFIFIVITTFSLTYSTLYFDLFLSIVLPFSVVIRVKCLTPQVSVMGVNYLVFYLDNYQHIMNVNV